MCPDNSGKNPAAAALKAGGQVIDSRELFAGKRELHIVHNDQLYVLRITANGKLILTK